MSARRYQRVIITGAAGFVGGRLLAHLAGRDDAPERIIAADVHIRPVDPAAGVQPVICDLSDADQTAELVEKFRPDGVIHLAGVAAGDDLSAYFTANVLACENLLAAAGRLTTPPRVLVVGSAAQYGVTSGEYEVVDETRPLLGGTPYGLSKTLQEQWARLYAEARSLPVICVRPFNIIGPGQPETLVPATFLRQAADVLDGRAEEICVGNTDTQRDFTDVRDVAAAMWSLMNAESSADGQVFNIASGQAVKISDMLAECVKLAGRDIPIRRDPARMKTFDVPTIIGQALKLHAAVVWRPQILWRQSLKDMWANLRGRQ